jgi:hypothetical protein
MEPTKRIFHTQHHSEEVTDALEQSMTTWLICRMHLNAKTTLRQLLFLSYIGDGIKEIK